MAVCVFLGGGSLISALMTFMHGDGADDKGSGTTALSRGWWCLPTYDICWFFFLTRVSPIGSLLYEPSSHAMLLQVAPVL